MGVLTALVIPFILKTVPSDRSHAIDIGLALGKVTHTLKTLTPWIISPLFACSTLP